MLSLILIIVAGLLGIVGHWWNRWRDGRTQNTFLEYLAVYKANTLGSVFANLNASAAICASIPEDISGRALMLVVLGSYSAGYMLDSKINKEEPSGEQFTKKAAEITPKQEAADDDESLADILRRDANR